jgi:hypothetical protein
VLTLSTAKTVAKAFEIDLVNHREQSDDRSLDDLVFQRRPVGLVKRANGRSLPSFFGIHFRREASAR